MDKEMEFKNKSIKEKVNGSFEMIIVLYVVSVAFAVFLMFAVKIVPSATEYFVLAGGIVVLAIITVCSILATLKRAKMLIHYIVEPVRELSSVAEKISGGELDIEIAYQSEDEIGELAEDFRKTATTLQRIIGDLNHILDAFAKGDYTVKSGCRDAYVGEFDTVHAKLIATTEHVSDALKSIRESKASRLTKSVKYVVLNCTTCVPLPVRKQESKKRESNLSDSIAIRKAIQRNAGWLFVYRFLQCLS